MTRLEQLDSWIECTVNATDTRTSDSGELRVTAPNWGEHALIIVIQQTRTSSHYSL
jgi:hypothetical protein